MADQEQPAKIGNVLHPVGDVGAAISFYRDTFGFGLKFADGDRYAALDAGGTTLALASPEDDITGGIVSASVKVADVGQAVEAVVAAGGTVVRAPEQGPHEVAALVRDPWNNLIIIYG
ncbi:VOC family protein [Pseudonocardia spinosispora]|uniref:VOC family protein n=1 Tax=Pseudonocardia spinosispora TaxID=103441 RepID=UPI00040B2882|nr:VOC family protein [Pseudonocardia spinosispora]